MFSLYEAQFDLQELDQRSKKLIASILTEIPLCESERIIPAGGCLKSDCYYFVKDGSFSFVKNGQVLCFFDEGDLVGLPYQLNHPDSELSSSFAVVVDEYSHDDFDRIRAHNENLQSAWDEYLYLQVELFTVLLGSVLKSEKHSVAMVRHFGPGETILEQGTSGGEVFTLVEGSADVLVDGIKVGEISADQIFGEIAALTGTVRSADVVARSNCIVTVLPNDNFIELLETRPQTVIKMAQNMAGTITRLNSKVIELTSKQT